MMSYLFGLKRTRTGAIRLNKMIRKFTSILCILHDFLLQLADSKVIRSAARLFVSAVYGMRVSIFQDFWKRIEFFSKALGEEFKKSSKK